MFITIGISFSIIILKGEIHNIDESQGFDN